MKIRGTTVGTSIKPEKVVVKCKNLTEDEKVIARNNIGAASVETIGDIETALDAIIAIQDELIGETTISFSISNAVHTADKGMTWREWVESDYNADGYEVNDGENPSISRLGMPVINSSGELVAADDLIIANGQYDINADGWEV